MIHADNRPDDRSDRSYRLLCGWSAKPEAYSPPGRAISRSCHPYQPCAHVKMFNITGHSDRVIMNLSLRDHVKPALKQLHWLPVQQRITYKLCLFMHQIHNGQAPQYLSDCVSTVSAASHRHRLRSSGSAVYVLPRTRTRFGERFFYSSPAAWNTLPSNLHDISDTSTFRK